MLPITPVQTLTRPAARGDTSDLDLHLSLLQATLDHVDYGMAVVNADTHELVFANAHALRALQPAGSCASGLCVSQGRLHTRQAADAVQLDVALAKTRDRVRGLLRLTHHTKPQDSSANAAPDQTVAVMPLSGFRATDRSAPIDISASVVRRTPNYALLVFSKEQLCDTTTVTLFARERGLTSAEGQVLAQVCKGLRASQIATHHGVQVSTVRTQLRSIRQKTASDSVRELIEKVSVLPPLARHVPRYPNSGQTNVGGVGASGGLRRYVPCQ